MAKYVVSHQMPQGATYVYLIRAINVEADFDNRPEKKDKWMSIQHVAEVVKDGRSPRGTVHLSMRLLASALQDFLFNDRELKISVSGEVICLERTEALAEARLLVDNIHKSVLHMDTGSQEQRTSASSQSFKKVVKKPKGISPGQAIVVYRTPGRGMPLSQEPSQSKRTRSICSPAQGSIEAAQASTSMTLPPPMAKEQSTPEEVTKKAKAGQVGEWCR